MNTIKPVSILIIFCIWLFPTNQTAGFHAINHHRSLIKGLHKSYEEYKRPKSFESNSPAGEVANIIDYPWTVSLQIQGDHICSGVILNKLHVLTDAYCVLNVRTRSLTLRAGYSDNKVNGQVVFAKSINIHPNYNGTDYYLENSLAIVELKTQLNYTNLIKPINLLKLNEKNVNMVKENSTVLVAGWEPMSNPIRMMKQNVVRIISNRKCQSYYRGNINDLKLFCAEVANGMDEVDRGSCQADFGGPIFKSHGKHKIVIGIVVWGHGCDNPLRPGIYVRIQPHMEWLNKFK